MYFNKFSTKTHHFHVNSRNEDNAINFQVANFSLKSYLTLLSKHLNKDFF